MNLAIIGAGGMATYHLQGFRKAGANVVAIIDVNTEAGKTFAQSNHIDHSFTSLKDAINANLDLEGVSVAIPNKFHFSQVLEALNYSLSVFCEKPPALNASEMKQMKEKSEEKGKLLLFDFNNRLRPESLAMMDYIKTGAVGQINTVQASWIRRNGIPGFGGWFTNKAMSGGGPTIDLLHMLDLGLHFMGYPEPKYVSAVTFDTFMGNPAFKGPWNIKDSKNGVCDVETSLHAMLVFKTGQSLMLRNSWAEMNQRETVSVVFQGTKAGGKVERIFDVDGLDETSHDKAELYTVENGRQVDRNVKFIPDETMGRLDSAMNFVECIKGEAKPFNTPSEAYILMKIIDALYESAEQMKSVEVK
ncbi:MAG: Gfo/Idh/MocA family oxidoreductase [Sphaerochaetaceae bacterium]